MVGIGSSRSWNPDVAVRECVRKAFDALRTPGRPAWALAFCGGKLDPETIAQALGRELAGVPVVLGSAAGTVTAAHVGYSGFELALALFPKSLSPAAILLETGLEAGEGEAGRRLGERIAATARPDDVVLMFYASVAQNRPLRLHPASLLMAGIHEGLGAKPVTVIGGGTLTDIDLTDSWIVCSGQVRRHAVVAVVLPSWVRARTAILHGCLPVSTFFEVTRIDGAELFELDGRPALDVIESMLGIPRGASRTQDLSLTLTLGEKIGDPFGPYDENAYVNRLILDADPVRRSITLFEQDFHVGSMVQIMSRDNMLMLESVRNGARAVSDAGRELDCLFALYIDCAGRTSVRSGAAMEEAEVLLDSFSLDVPLLGFYSGVEIAPVNAVSRPLDWTGVLTLLYRERPRDGRGF